MHLALIPLLLAAPLADAAPEGERTLTMEEIRAVSVEMPLGALLVSAAPGSDVFAYLVRSCEGEADCAPVPSVLRVEASAHEGILRLEVEGYDDLKGHRGKDLDVVLKVTMPADLDLDVELGMGEATLSGLTGDVSLEIGVGAAHVSLPKAAFERADLACAMGDVQMSVGGVAVDPSGWIAKEIRWREGRGAHTLKVEVGMGEVDVRLAE